MRLRSPWDQRAHSRMFKKKDRYPDLDDLKIKRIKIFVNKWEFYKLDENLTREAFALRKLLEKDKREVQQKEYILTRDVGLNFVI